MKMKIVEEEYLEVHPCKCGCYPKAHRPNYDHTDVWLICENCGETTCNHGGYHFASEIPYIEGLRAAVEEWNGKHPNKSIPTKKERHDFWSGLFEWCADILELIVEVLD